MGDTYCRLNLKRTIVQVVTGDLQDHDLDVLFLFVSVATHKYAIAFAVSLDFLLSGVNTKMIVVYTVCFSLVNPVGIGLGIISHLISDQEEGNIDSVVSSSSLKLATQ